METITKKIIHKDQDEIHTLLPPTVQYQYSEQQPTANRSEKEKITPYWITVEVEELVNESISRYYNR